MPLKRLRKLLFEAYTIVKDIDEDLDQNSNRDLTLDGAVSFEKIINVPQDRPKLFLIKGGDDIHEPGDET